MNGSGNGLFPGFVISYQSNTAKDVLDTIMSIQPKDSGGGSGETRESVVTRQADDMLEKLPNDYIPHEVRMVYRLHNIAGNKLEGCLPKEATMRS